MTNKKIWQSYYLMMTKSAFKRTGPKGIELSTNGGQDKSINTDLQPFAHRFYCSILFPLETYMGINLQLNNPYVLRSF